MLQKVNLFMQQKEDNALLATDDKKKKGKKTSMNDAEVRAKKRQHEMRLWEKRASPLPQRKMKMRVWHSLNEFLNRYNKLLTSRAANIDVAVNLQNENEQLKQLLDQYLSSKINEELQVPPTHVIRAIMSKP